MSKSVDRVRAAAAKCGLAIDICRFGQSTRTAQEAAEQCGCLVDQIVKSLIFESADSGTLVLFLVPGNHRLDLKRAATAFGETVKRADPDLVRERTGFAIGGVSPLGSLEPMPVFAAPELLVHATVWAAAGAHDAVFEVAPSALIAAAKATVADISGE